MRFAVNIGIVWLTLASIGDSFAADTAKGSGQTGVAVVIEGIPAVATGEAATIAVGVTNFGPDSRDIALSGTLVSSSIASGSLPASVLLEAGQTEQYFLDITVLASDDIPTVEVRAEDMANTAIFDLAEYSLLTNELFNSGFEPSEAAAPPQVIFVTRSGNRRGTVSSDPAGISCGANCAEFVDPGSMIQLSAEPFLGAQFAGWSGPCSGLDDCSFVVEEPTEIFAEFEVVPPIEVTLSASPIMIAPGRPTEISWTVENYVVGEDSCTTQGPSSFGEEFQQNIAAGSVIYRLLDPFTFSLDCGEDAASVTVTVTPDGFPAPPAFCEPEPAGRLLPFEFTYPLEFTPRTAFNYAEIWGPWPEPQANEAIIRVPRLNYISMPFYANADNGRFWQIRWLGGPRSADSTQVTVSRCPGDFDGNDGMGYSDPLCNQVSGSEGGVILVVTDENEDGGDLACPVLPGADELYYLNVRHTDAEGENQCNEFRCNFFADPRLLN